MYFTVFTPTYNRAYLLGQVYASLLNQSYIDFKWVIIDDGSKDNTEELVLSWIKEGRLNIIYEKQDNQGRFAALKYFEGELLVVLDSDDCLKNHALKSLHTCWESEKGNHYCGIISYMIDQQDKIIGTPFPPNLEAQRIYELRDKYRMKGDKAVFFSIDKIKKYKYPIIKGEKFIGDDFIMNLVNEIEPMYILRDTLYIREYQKDSITNHLVSTWCNSPVGMSIYYNQTMNYIHYDKLRYFVYAMKYVCFAYMSNQKNIIVNANKKTAVLIMYIPGLIYCRYLKYKNKK